MPSQDALRTLARSSWLELKFTHFAGHPCTSVNETYPTLTGNTEQPRRLVSVSLSLSTRNGQVYVMLPGRDTVSVPVGSFRCKYPWTSTTNL
jgi:hypothetical protein